MTFKVQVVSIDKPTLRLASGVARKLYRLGRRRSAALHEVQWRVDSALKAIASGKREDLVHADRALDAVLRLGRPRKAAIGG